MAPAPLSARAGATHAWTGREVLVWSGAASSLTANGEALPDGALYDPSRDTWRRMAASPLAGRVAPSSVWTGEELVVWGGNPGAPAVFAVFADGAAYNPTTDTWRRIAPSPVAGRAGAVTVWNGTEVVLWGGLGLADPAVPLPGLEPRLEGGIVPLGDGAAFNPAANAWRRLERSSLLARAYALGAWDGEGLIVWGGLVAVDSPASAADGARYVP